MGWSTHKIIPKSCADLAFRAIEAELIRNAGNVTETAKTLGVPSADVRKLVWSTKLADTVYEVAEGKLDEATQVLMDALSGADKTHRLQAAKFSPKPQTGGAAAGERARRSSSTRRSPPPRSSGWRTRPLPIAKGGR
jgi:hypothetical protein